MSVTDAREATSPAGNPMPSHPPTRRSHFSFNPLNLLVYAGVVLGAISLALAWVNVKVTFVLTVTLPFKLWENVWLGGITVALLAAVLVLVHWKRAGGWAAVVGGVGCLAIVGIYAYGMAAKAFHILGLLRNIPLIGGPLSDFARNLVSPSPAPGFILFVLGTILILAGGILLVRRGRQPRATRGLPQQNLS